MKAVQRLFIIGLAVCVILATALGSFLFVSLVPYFTPIGIATASVVIVGLGCVAVMFLSFTYNRVSVWASDRRQKQLLSRVVIVGEMAAYLDPNGQWEHLSARHEMAKIPPPPMVIEAPKSEPRADKETILEIYNTGQSIKETAKLLHTTEYEVRKVVNAEGVTRKKGD